MNFFPIKRPTVGVCIRAHAVSAVELERDWKTGWRTLRVRRVAERPIPAGLVKPSSTELNITDVGKLADEIQMLLERANPTAVSLSLPDACARTVLFDFETLPAKPAECAALIRWRFQKELNVPADAGRLAYRIFRLGAGKNSSGPARVLAAAVRRPIIEQYEQVSEKASLIPASMGLTSLALFDFCRPLMDRVLAQRVSNGSAPDEFFFGVIAEDGFSLLAVRDRVPVFLRMKGRNGNGSAASLVPRASLADELIATLQFYDESIRTGRAVEQARPIFIAGTGAEDVLDGRTAKGVGVEVLPMTWKSFPMWQSTQSDPPPASTLAAVAGLRRMT
jgi:hypothetical protein